MSSIQANPVPFPADAWRPEFVGVAANPTRYLPPDWPDLIQLPPPPLDHLAAECQTVMDLGRRQRPTRLPEILRQSESAEAAVWPVQSLIGNPWDPRRLQAAIDVVDAIFVDLFPVIVYFKQLFKRGRPHHCCKLDPPEMFARPDRRYPGHASYPSGHAAQAYAVALLYQHMFEGAKTGLLDAAARVAENRVVAGVHFPSDSEAGRLLAEQFMKLMLDNPEFGKLVKLAKSEWTAFGPA